MATRNLSTSVAEIVAPTNVQKRLHGQTHFYLSHTNMKMHTIYKFHLEHLGPYIIHHSHSKKNPLKEYG